MDDPTAGWRDQIRFVSDLTDDEEARNRAIDILERAIAEAADYMEAAGFDRTLEEYLVDFFVTITDRESQYYIDLSPYSGEGHDGTFAVDKATGLLDRYSLAVGNVLPEPEDGEGWE